VNTVIQHAITLTLMLRNGNARVPRHFVWRKTEIPLREGSDPPETPWD
jgi:hypothetical protein